MILLSTQILEAREQLLQSLQSQNKRGSNVPDESSESSNASAAPAEEKVIEPSIIRDKADTPEKSSFEEPSSDITPEIVSEKFPISTTEVEMVDKSVVEEELAVTKESKASPVESKLRFEADEEEVDEWPDDDPTDEVGQAQAGHRASLGREEDVSFSDLEDDEDDHRNRRDEQ